MFFFFFLPTLRLLKQEFHQGFDVGETVSFTGMRILQRRVPGLFVIMFHLPKAQKKRPVAPFSCGHENPTSASRTLEFSIAGQNARTTTAWIAPHSLHAKPGRLSVLFGHVGLVRGGLIIASRMTGDPGNLSSVKGIVPFVKRLGTGIDAVCTVCFEFEQCARGVAGVWQPARRIAMNRSKVSFFMVPLDRNLVSQNLYGCFTRGCEVKTMYLPQQRSYVSVTVNVLPLTDHL
jgi:hypothetical protein